jgi:hypothetical protein
LHNGASKFVNNFNFAQPSQEDAEACKSLCFRSIYLYAWDLVDDGADRVLEWVSNSGLNTICLAATYHSGWLIKPHSAKHRAFMPEDGVCYFHPHEPFLLPGKSRLSVKVAEMAKAKDCLEEAAKRLDRYGLRLVAWTIGVHNTRLGLACPELTQENAYGDRLPHALCPANEAVCEYLNALCRDIALHYPVWALQLESFSWMGHVHGHHHERDLVDLTPLEQELMGLCFCNACSKEANNVNVDIMEVKTFVKSILDVAFREAPRRPKSHPRSMCELESKSSEFRKFNLWRKEFSYGLISGIKQNALRGTACRLLLQSGFEPALARVVDGFACDAYRKNPEETSSICRAGEAAVPEHWNGLFQCLIQLGMGIPESKLQLQNIITAVRDSGCNGVNFYNYSESPPKMLGWLSEVLPTFCT